jgi:EAL domain-containing protein (putative c-di-GMP-specific phosphodiesterase class I)
METEFDPLTTAHIDLQIEEEFPKIQLEAEKFELWFQPVYDLTTGVILHNEVLVRWRDGQGNLRQPQELFIALQNTQLLSQLDRIIVEKSISILSNQTNVTLSVNLSDDIFDDQQFLPQLHTWLDQYKVAPKRLYFEIEEEILFQKQSLVFPFITELQMMGCHVVIDNFTGKFFPLLQLQELPIKMIKLHRSFALKPVSPAKKQLATAISYSSRAFQIQTVLKGIDDNLSLKLANDIGIKGVQGYSLSRPQDKPKTFGLVGLFIIKIIAILILLYIVKSLLGINIFPEHHLWDIIVEFFQSLFDGK